jgi:cell division protease FtsH
MFTGDINTGASMDIKQATGVARRMVTEWGMNERLGFVFYGDDDMNPNAGLVPQKEYSDDTARLIDEEVKKLIDGLYDYTRQLLQQNKDRVEAVARALIQYETLDANDIDRIMKGDNLSKPTVSDLLDKEHRAAGTTIQPGHDNAQPDVQPGLGGGPLPNPA